MTPLPHHFGHRANGFCACALDPSLARIALSSHVRSNWHLIALFQLEVRNLSFKRLSERRSGFSYSKGKGYEANESCCSLPPPRTLSKPMASELSTNPSLTIAAICPRRTSLSKRRNSAERWLALISAIPRHIGCYCFNGILSVATNFRSAIIWQTHSSPDKSFNSFTNSSSIEDAQ